MSAYIQGYVVLEEIKSIETIQEIAKEFDIRPVQVSEWKKPITKNAARVFRDHFFSSRGGRSSWWSVRK